MYVYMYVQASGVSSLVSLGIRVVASVCTSRFRKMGFVSDSRTFLVSPFISQFLFLLGTGSPLDLRQCRATGFWAVADCFRAAEELEGVVEDELRGVLDWLVEHEGEGWYGC